MCCPIISSPSPRVARAVAVFGWITLVIATACWVMGFALTGLAIAHNDHGGGFIFILTFPMIFLGAVWSAMGLMEVLGSGQCTSCTCGGSCLGSMLGVSSAIRIITALVLLALINSMIAENIRAHQPSPPPYPSWPPAPPNLPMPPFGDVGSGDFQTMWPMQPPTPPAFPPVPPYPPYTPPDVTFPVTVFVLLLLKMIGCAILDIVLASAQCRVGDAVVPPPQVGTEMQQTMPVAQAHLVQQPVPIMPVPQAQVAVGVPVQGDPCLVSL